jgi:hypothetical protein
MASFKNGLTEVKNLERQVTLQWTVNMELARKINLISLDAVNLMPHYSSLFMEAIGKEETNQFTAS